mmetsp:Transcript_13379/g.47195  ORF Transcript_13379/g.47195 Transcript_13379/m.47195 type:complete len:345 (-) Transcript_13379:392-1426(-)
MGSTAFRSDLRHRLLPELDLHAQAFRQSHNARLQGLHGLGALLGDALCLGGALLRSAPRRLELGVLPPGLRLQALHLLSLRCKLGLEVTKALILPRLPLGEHLQALPQQLQTSPEALLDLAPALADIARELLEVRRQCRAAPHRRRSRCTGGAAAELLAKGFQALAEERQAVVQGVLPNHQRQMGRELPIRRNSNRGVPELILHECSLLQLPQRCTTCHELGLVPVDVMVAHLQLPTCTGTDGTQGFGEARSDTEIRLLQDRVPQVGKCLNQQRRATATGGTQAAPEIQSGTASPNGNTRRRRRGNRTTPRTSWPGRACKQPDGIGVLGVTVAWKKLPGNTGGA